MPIDSLVRLLPVTLAAAMLLLAPSSTGARVSEALKTKAPASEAAAGTKVQESTEQMRARVRMLLDEARTELEQTPEPVPAGVTQAETEQLRDARMRLAAAYDIQLRAIEQLDQAVAGRKAAEDRARDWTGFDTQPPYSILRIDQLREAAHTASEQLKTLDTALAQMQIDGEHLQDELRRAGQDERRAAEQFESAATAEDKALWAWQRTAAEIRQKAAAAGTTAVTLFERNRGDLRAARRAELDLLERQIGLAERNMSFSAADLESMHKLVNERAAGIRRELAAVELQIGQRQREAETAAASLAKERTRPGTTSAELAVAEARLSAARTWVGVRREQSDALRGLLLLHEVLGTLWSARFMAYDAGAATRLVAQAKLREAQTQLAHRKSNVENLVRESRTRLAETEARLADGNFAAPVLRYEQDALAARREALLTGERLQNGIESTTQQLASWTAQLEQARSERTVGARLTDAWVTLRAAAQAVWNFELFSAEDTTIVDGQHVTLSRGVTVGKSVGAILFFVLGLLLISALARAVERKLVQRGMDAARARTGKRWILAVLAVVLLLLTLNIAKIPVTVFAFLGGALAIGAGFGIQTLIKNLASGVVMMTERLIKVGDIVEVEGVSGTITEVNLRSSTVLTFDGTESIIPNSVFVESKVTNWTGSNRKVRRVVKVGVAYGSPVRAVADMLEQCAQRHGLVLKDPAPLVIFEDFGDSALVFALYFWLELQPNMSSTHVMSDLRFMIEKQLAEAGVSIAFPQRDLHLDASKPLRIELVAPTASDPTV